MRGNNKLFYAALLLSGVAVFGLCRRWPLLNGPAEWTWPYLTAPLPLWKIWWKAVGWLAAGGLIPGVLYLILRRRLDSIVSRRMAGLAILFLWGLFYHWVSFAAWTPLGISCLPRAIIEPTTTAYYTDSLTIGMKGLPGKDDALGRLFNVFRAGQPDAFLTRPPGFILDLRPVSIAGKSPDPFQMNPDANGSKASGWNRRQWVEKAAERKLPEIADTLRYYPIFMKKLQGHSLTKPPGPLLVCYFWRRLFESHPGLTGAALKFFNWIGAKKDTFHPPSPAAGATAIAVGLTLMAGGLLGLFPLFGLVRLNHPESDQDGAAAWAAAFLWLSYPALILFEPQFDQLYPTLTLLCLYCLARGLKQDAPGWGIPAGLLFMLAVFFSFTMLFLAPMMVLMALFEQIRRAGSFRPEAWLKGLSPRLPAGRRLWLLLGTAALTALLIDQLLWICWRINLWEILSSARETQKIYLLPIVRRTYSTWLFFNVFDFLFYGGVALAVLGIAWLLRMTARLRANPRLLPPGWLPFSLMLLLIDLSGLTPAETARIWLFLAPGLAWAGAEQLVEGCPGRWKLNLFILLAAQCFFLYVCRTRLQFIHW